MKRKADTEDAVLDVARRELFEAGYSEETLPSYDVIEKIVMFIVDDHFAAMVEDVKTKILEHIEEAKEKPLPGQDEWRTSKLEFGWS